METNSQQIATENIQNYQKFNFWSFLFWSIIIIILALKLIVFQQVTVVGDSMNPSFNNGELLLVNQINNDFQRGYVVAVYEDETVSKNANYFTRYSATFFLKRIVGLPGEEIEIIGSNVIIYNDQFPNGAVLDEPYIPDSTKTTEDRSTYYPRTRIPEGEYFVLGDNRSNSTDSRVRGSFPRYSMFGVVSMRFWPLSHITLTEHNDYTYSRLTPDVIARRVILQAANRGQLN